MNLASRDVVDVEKVEIVTDSKGVNSLKAMWSEPLNPNGIILVYHIRLVHHDLTKILLGSKNVILLTLNKT